jgi:hypothetical protein
MNSKSFSKVQDSSNFEFHNGASVSFSACVWHFVSGLPAMAQVQYGSDLVIQSAFRMPVADTIDTLNLFGKGRPPTVTEVISEMVLVGASGTSSAAETGGEDRDTSKAETSPRSVHASGRVALHAAGADDAAGAVGKIVS